MSIKTCFASIDVEQDLGANTFRGVEGLEKILSIFRKYDIVATLFVTGETLQKYPEQFQKLALSYEIACHGFTHRFWNTLNSGERRVELDNFINLYQRIFQKAPKGFRAPSHVIDAGGLKLLEEKGFLYDSSIVPRYPLFKKYRGYNGRKPQDIYFISGLVESPVTGLIFGIPLAGAWISGLPTWLYRFLFLFHRFNYITLNMHSWDILKPDFTKKLEEIIKILKKKNYQFLNGEQIFKNRQ